MPTAGVLMGNSAADESHDPGEGSGPSSERLSLEDTISLLGRAQAGDDRALEVVCSRYLPQLYRWAAGRLPRNMKRVVETGDLVQEVLLGTIRCLDDLHPRYPGSFPAYLRKAILNRINDETRRAARRPSPSALHGNEPDAAPSPLDRAVGRDLQAQYEDALMRLKESDRAAVFLRIELKVDYQEIATVLGKPSTDAARMCVQRALVRLAEEMSDDV